MKIIETETNNIQQTPNNIGRKIRDKCNTVFEKNKGYNTMQKFQKYKAENIIQTIKIIYEMFRTLTTLCILNTLTSHLLRYLQRRFSIYETLRLDNRRSFFV